MAAKSKKKSKDIGSMAADDFMQFGFDSDGDEDIASDTEASIDIAPKSKKRQKSK